MEKQDGSFEALLARRKLEDASPDLAERIISASQAMPQRRSTDLGAWLVRLFAEFMLPRPTYALAAVLLIGFFLGFGGSSVNADDSVPAADYVQEFLYDNGAVL